ncbi:sporulation two-component system sensor histidine kinase KinE [Bacillus vallismortis]|uniref:sporulation two-component system sensor histidine kinase KinE n=1 Tax=Bacillus vallismortis TaxID=72361 RepID=UPI000C29E4ED|nr:sporulation two-component system sensor histidine kinase KinE [Bacillus vallismortis]MCI3985784.1 sporulation two-component system sensor histidine kinase KinE [Bacillus vallismortis]MCY7918845.1 sporulation two-component system sensor histidine kinase KinE [Bacillus vallismortis]MCY8533639.1 sporulation two-component system sensor histidine kinase KinE [Bacillus vallismortis]MEC1652396.1 sporulation two-component system sensor histidine kinase KinE [Bacillus vallismortis]MEC1793286.1 sporu
METLDAQTNSELREELKRLKEENARLKKELNQHQVIVNNTLDAIFICDNELRIVQANEATERMLQVDSEDLKNRSVLDFLFSIPKDELNLAVKKFFKKGFLWKEVPVRLDGGAIKYIEFLAKRGIGEDFFFVVMRDISSKKILEREFSMNEQLFKDLFDRAVDGIVLFDKDGGFIDANLSFCKSFEINQNELSHLSLYEFIDSGSHKDFDNTWKTLNRKGKAKGELPVKLRSGVHKLFEFTITSNIISGFYMSIMRDITEKRSMELQLFKSEERFREIFENAMDAIIIWSNDGRIVKANQSACKIFELPMNLLLKRKLCDFLVHSQRKYSITKKKYAKYGEIREEMLFQMGNGQFKELEFTSKRTILENQHLTILRNVSDRKRMEKELRESELKFRKVFNGSMDGNVLFDNQYRIIDANPLASKILGLSHEEIKKHSLLDIISSYDIENLASPARQINFDEMDNEIPFLLSSSDNRKLEFSFKRNIIQNMNLAIFKDVTERKELEERLRKSDTLHVVGELAAGIAHEIRNPMTALKGFIQLLKGSVAGDYALYFNVITSELKRIESIITEFLILAKPQAIMYEEKHVTQIMRDTIDLLNAQANLSNVQMHLDLMDDIPPIYCEPNQLKQVFINILKNAIEVMPDGGNISVTIRTLDQDHVLISLKDEGVGMSEDKVRRLGEPFYTTKERGTGLGLMVSYKIIEEHQGEIMVESEEGKGTVFHLTLPVRQNAEERRTDE